MREIDRLLIPFSKNNEIGGCRNNLRLFKENNLTLIKIFNLRTSAPTRLSCWNRILPVTFVQGFYYFIIEQDKISEDFYIKSKR